MSEAVDTADPRAEPAQLREGLRRTASVLKAANVPFALTGSYALWVHGAPEPEHDVDLVVPEAEAEAAASCLADAGLQVERPPEDWLFKVWVDGALVDVLHRLQGVAVEQDLVERAEEHEILGLRILVVPATEIMVTKLQALTEHYCDFAALLPVFRAVREQLDWPRLHEAASGSPFAEAFLFLLQRLGVAPPD